MTKFFTIVRQSIAIAAAAASGTALMCVPAFADTLPTTTVSFADLDLSSAAGQAKMQNRMRAAARQVCGYNTSERDLGQMADQNVCIARAMTGAQVDLAAATSFTTSSGQRVAVRDAAVRNVPGRAR